MGAAALKAGHSNTIFTVRDIVDDNGDVIQSYEFSEHGLPMPGSGAASGTFSPKTYQGGLSVNDDRNDSGLYLMGHRHYAAELGRFISRDPIGFAGGLNLFNGASTNPVTFVDPSGLLTADAALLSRLDHFFTLGGGRNMGYSSGQEFLDASIAKANEILYNANLGQNCNTQHGRTTRQIIRDIRDIVNSPNWKWGYDSEFKTGYAYTWRDEPASGNQSNLTEVGVRDFSPGLRRYPTVAIEEVMASFIIHEAFHKYRGGLLKECGDQRYTTDDHGPNSDGPLFWFARGVLGPYWDPTWRSPWTGPMVP
jgi:RHS repeat-associated protein